MYLDISDLLLKNLRKQYEKSQAGQKVEEGNPRQ